MGRHEDSKAQLLSSDLTLNSHTHTHIVYLHAKRWDILWTLRFDQLFSSDLTFNSHTLIHTHSVPTYQKMGI